jgi:DNA-binding winged helix-turn-helix (wHTH) protein/pimeloyl-ACP methyl ester carboxylesterase
MQFRFGSFELDVTERRLNRSGQPVPLRSKVFDTLVLLVESQGKLLRKDKLIRKIWPDTIVGENNLDHSISELRRVLGEGKNGAKFIETVPRQGYRFVGKVFTADVDQVSSHQPEEEAAITQDINFFTTRDGVRIAYSKVGEGPALVKAANWLNHLEFELKSPVWRHWIPLLTKHNTLIRYDERGNGLSDWNVQDFSFEAWCRDFEQLIDELKLEKFSLLGISQGAAVSVWYAARYPERVEKLILYGSFARGWTKRNIPGEIERRNALLTLVRLGWGNDNPAFRQMFATIFMPDGTAEHQQWYNELQRVCTSPENAVQLLNAGGHIDVVDQLTKVKCSALVIHCTGDEVVPIAEGRLVAARIPRSQFVQLPGRNHLVIHTEPAWPIFVRSLSEFMGWDAPQKTEAGSPRPASHAR